MIGTNTRKMRDTSVTTRSLTDRRQPCNCEHTRHFDFQVDVSGVVTRIDDVHTYMSVPAGTHSAMYIGSVCDDCAVTCMEDWLQLIHHLPGPNGLTLCGIPIHEPPADVILCFECSHDGHRNPF